MSILSYSERGPWGDSQWRGNCSGHIYRELFARVKPRFFIDPMVGSGTSIEVARDMKIEALGLDLHSGFNAIRDSILVRAGKPAELVVSHPPYGSMVTYSGEVWGEAHADDLSRCTDDADFHDKLQLVLLNQREATTVGGIYGVIIGDRSHDGRYTSYQAECIARMPSDELVTVLIKAQHAVRSQSSQYNPLRWPRISHEYILLWRRRGSSLLVALGDIAREQQSRMRATWRNIVRLAMISGEPEAHLSEIYDRVALAAPERIKTSEHWKAKVRQVLQTSGCFESTARGHWRLTEVVV